MWTLTIPDNTSAIDELIIALTYANGVPVYALSEQEKQIVGNLYDRYDNLKAHPAPELRKPQLSDQLKGVIREAYAEVQQGRRLHSLRERLKLAAPRCPLCSIGAVTDLDHHLPRSQFAALSVYSRNLVPACTTCNNKKRTIAADTPNRRLIHAYLDDLPQERFLRTDVTIAQNSVLFEFRIERISGMSAELYERLRFQLERLELNRRYSAEINVFWSSQEVALTDAYGTDLNALKLREFLQRSAMVMDRRFGINDWRAALLHDSACSDDFCHGGFRLLFT
jgi:hypothetical protein